MRNAGLKWNGLSKESRDFWNGKANEEEEEGMETMSQAKVLSEIRKHKCSLLTEVITLA